LDRRTNIEFKKDQEALGGEEVDVGGEEE